MSKNSRRNRKIRKQQMLKAQSNQVKIILDDERDIKVMIYGLTEDEDKYFDCASMSEALLLKQNLELTKVVSHIIVDDDFVTEEEIKAILQEESGTTPATTTATTVKKYTYKKQCHIVKEVYKNIILGDRWAIRDILALKPDVLIPLASIPASIWDLGFRGKVYALPVEDYGTLPTDVLAMAMTDIVPLVTKKNKKVAIFCEGGHGRTGYIASVLIGLIDKTIPDPIKYIRENYCSHTVESTEQVKAIADALGKPELNSNSASSVARYGYACGYDNDYSYQDNIYTGYARTGGTNASTSYTSYNPASSYLTKKCSQCDYYKPKCNECRYDMSYKEPTAWACTHFLPLPADKLQDSKIKKCADCKKFEETNFYNANTVNAFSSGSCKKMENVSHYTTSLKIACNAFEDKNVDPNVEQEEQNCGNCRWKKLDHKNNYQEVCGLDEELVTDFYTCSEWTAKMKVFTNKEIIDDAMSDQEINDLIQQYQDKMIQEEEQKLEGEMINNG